MNKKDIQESVAERKNGISDSNKVHETIDYSIFKRIEGNRNIDHSHLNRLKESMRQIDLMIPIIVNEKMEVIDGQHRLQARTDLNIPVYYVVIPKLGLKETQAANVNNKNWTYADFMNAYVSQNYYHYKKYKEFREKYKFDHSESVKILSDNKGFQTSREFRNGEFVIYDWDRACEFAEKMYLIEPYYKGFKRRSFISAMTDLFRHEEFDFGEFLQKLSYQSSKMVDCTNKVQYIKLIEDIYNYKKPLQDKVRFI